MYKKVSKLVLSTQRLTFMLTSIIRVEENSEDNEQDIRFQDSLKLEFFLPSYLEGSCLVYTK